MYTFLYENMISKKNQLIPSVSGMRIDVKTVKGTHYLQYVDKNGYLHHLGVASDFDTWLLSLIIWNKEYLDMRKELFESVKAKARQYIELDERKEKIIDAIFYRYVPNASEAHKKRILVPKSVLWIPLEVDKNILQRYRRLYDQVARVGFTEDLMVNLREMEDFLQKPRDEARNREQEWSARLQKRLDEVYAKQRKVERKKRRVK